MVQSPVSNWVLRISRPLFFATIVCPFDFASATRANRAALDRCTTCHLPGDNKNPENLGDFPHKAFGDRLRKLGAELEAAGKPKDIATRLAIVAKEDADGDGVPNEVELLLGHNPGDEKDKPSEKEFAAADARRADFAKFAAAYRWRPFETVRRPSVPTIKNAAWVRNPADAFIAAEHEARGLKPRPEASKEILLRRIYVDLIGLVPTSEEQRAFLADTGAGEQRTRRRRHQGRRAARRDG